MGKIATIILLIVGISSIFFFHSFKSEPEEAVFEKQTLSYRDLIGTWRVDEYNPSADTTIKVYSNQNSELVGETEEVFGDMRELGITTGLLKWQKIEVYPEYIQMVDIIAMQDNRKATKVVIGKFKKNNTVLEIYDTETGRLFYSLEKFK